MEPRSALDSGRPAGSGPSRGGRGDGPYLEVCGGLGPGRGGCVVRRRRGGAWRGTIRDRPGVEPLPADRFRCVRHAPSREPGLPQGGQTADREGRRRAGDSGGRCRGLPRGERRPDRVREAGRDGLRLSRWRGAHLRPGPGHPAVPGRARPRRADRRTPARPQPARIRDGVDPEVRLLQPRRLLVLRPDTHPGVNVGQERPLRRPDPARPLRRPDAAHHGRATRLRRGGRACRREVAGPG